MVRASLNYVSWKQRKAVANDLRQVYQSATAYEADLQLDSFAKKWDGICPMVSQTWRRHWERITPFFAYPAEIRKVKQMMYNAIMVGGWGRVETARGELRR